jgi:hypothetical protein
LFAFFCVAWWGLQIHHIPQRCGPATGDDAIDEIEAAIKSSK